MSVHEDESTNDVELVRNGGDSEVGDLTEEEQNSLCTICQEEWTLSAEHRICCLKCGHLFGKSCILRWISTQGSAAKCPICNKLCRKGDVRELWCKAFKATDNSELTELRRLLDSERALRKSDAGVIFHQNLKLQLLHADMENLKRAIIDRDVKIKRMETVLSKYSKIFAQRNSAAAAAATATGDEEQLVDISEFIDPKADLEVSCMDQPAIVAEELKGKFHFAERVESSPMGGCKAFAICPTAAILLLAQPSPQTSGANIFGAYGLRKFSVIDTNVREFIPLHSKEITSIKLKPAGDLVLTASADKRVRLTSISNNTCIQSFQSQYEPTCVAWSAHRDQQFYVASANCFVSLYDMRNTQEHIYQTERRVARSRTLSIAATSSENNLNGLLFNDIQGCQFLEVSDNSDYDSETIDRSLSHLTSHELPFAGMMGTVDYCKRLDLSLISTRKTVQQATLAHNLVKLNKVQREDGSTVVECKGIKTFLGRGSSELLSQSRLLKHPTLDDHVLVGAADPASRGIKLWDSSDNSEYQTIKEPEFMRDLLIFSPEQTNQHTLYTLSDKGICIYRWDFA